MDCYSEAALTTTRVCLKFGSITAVSYTGRYAKTAAIAEVRLVIQSPEEKTVVWIVTVKRLSQRLGCAHSLDLLLLWVTQVDTQKGSNYRSTACDSKS